MYGTLDPIHFNLPISSTTHSSTNSSTTSTTTCISNSNITHNQANSELVNSVIPADLDSLLFQSIPNLEEFDQHLSQNINHSNDFNARKLQSNVFKIVNLNQNDPFNSTSSVNQFINTSNNIIQPNTLTEYSTQFTYLNNYNHFSNNSASKNIPLVSLKLPVQIVTLNNHEAFADLDKNSQLKKRSKPADEFDESESVNSRSCKKKYDEQNIACNVCGEKSSGFHYGSHTCEACKLFFRTEKLIRKTGFSECKNSKNCIITLKNRSDCAECRYKKCIAVGMSMSRSQFGRHTQKQISSNYSPNIIESLCNLITNIKQKCLSNNLDLNQLNFLIVDFYFDGLKLLSDSNHESYLEELNDFEKKIHSSPASSQSTPLSELSAILKTNSSLHLTNSILLPRSTHILFCVLFDLHINFTENNVEAQTALYEFKEYLKFVQETVLTRQNKMEDILKIGIFFKCVRALLEKTPTKDDPIDKRLSDLMRSEISLFKFDDTNSSSSSTGMHLKNNQSLFNLGFLFSNLNHLIFRHMTMYELDNFVFKKVFF